MIKPDTPDNEEKRQESLESYEILDTVSEEQYDNIIELASFICNTPIALISFIDGDRQWFKAKKGISISQTKRDISFCGHAINQPDAGVFEIPNALEDERFKDNPLVEGEPKIRFYGGVPLLDEQGLPLGTLCVIDKIAKELTSSQKKSLEILSQQVSTHLRLKKLTKKKHKENLQLNAIVQNLNDVIYEVNYKGEFIFFNRSVEKMCGYKMDELMGKHFTFLVDPDYREEVALFYRRQLEEKTSYTELEFQVKPKKGPSFWVSQKVNIIFNPNGYAERIVAIVRDISSEKESQKQIIEKTKLLQTVISTMVEGVIVFNRKGDFIIYNEAAAKILMKDNDVDLQSCIASFNFFEEDKETKIPLEKLPSGEVLQGNSVKGKTVYLQPKEKPNTGFFIHINAQPMKDESGAIDGGIMVITNITDRKEREYEIVKNNSLIEHAKELAAIGHWEVNLEAGTVFWSEETRKIHEVSDDYVPNLEEGINFYDEDSRPVITAAIEKAITEKSSWDVKLKIITAKGNLRWVRAIGTAYSSKNKVNRLFGVFQDITQDKEFEDRLLKSEQKVRELNLSLEERIEQRTRELTKSRTMFQKLYDGAPDMLLSINPDSGKIIECNATTSKKLGYRKEEIIGKPVIGFYHPSCHEEVSKALSRIRQNGKVENKKLLICTNNGSTIPIRLNATIVKNSKGKPIRTNSTWRDISQLEKAEKALKKLNQVLEKRVEERTASLKKANEEIQEFAYITSHDLKSPIANIEGFFHLLKNDIKKNEHKNVDTFFHHIEGGINLAKKRIDGIVQVARIDSQSSRIITPFSLKSVIEEQLEQLQTSIHESKAKISIELNEVDLISSNPYYLATILSNILSNALKYKRDDAAPKVKLVVEKYNNEVEITVEDNGIGMDLSKGTEKLFGMFTRMHDHVDGSGLGMHITKKMVENLGGKINVKSAVNQGTCFVIRIPVNIKK